jgi:hypothetical protein
MRGHLLVWPFDNGGRYCRGGRWRRDFSVQHADERSSSASAIVAASTLRTPWGRTRPPRHLDRRIRYALQVCEPEYYTERQREELDKERSSVLSNQ